MATEHILLSEMPIAWRSGHLSWRVRRLMWNSPYGFSRSDILRQLQDKVGPRLRYQDNILCTYGSRQIERWFSSSQQKRLGFIVISWPFPIPSSRFVSLSLSLFFLAGYGIWASCWHHLRKLLNVSEIPFPYPHLIYLGQIWDFSRELAVLWCWIFACDMDRPRLTPVSRRQLLLGM